MEQQLLRPLIRKRFIDGKYECLHFAIEAWHCLTGCDLKGILVVDKSSIKAFETLREPSKLCLVLMQAPFVRPHLGVWIDNKVLHLTKSGVEYVDLEVAMRTHKTVRFVCPKH